MHAYFDQLVQRQADDTRGLDRLCRPKVAYFLDATLGAALRAIGALDDGGRLPQAACGGRPLRHYYIATAIFQQPCNSPSGA